MNWVKHLVTAPIFSSEQAGDVKHDSSSSPGISDQEKEMAISAFQAFKVNYIYSRTRAGDIYSLFSFHCWQVVVCCFVGWKLRIVSETA